MAHVIPFHSLPSVNRAEVLCQGPAEVENVLASLPELLAATHRITPVERAGHVFAVCLCGHWSEVFFDVPTMCAVEWIVSLRAGMTHLQFVRDLTRTLAAGRREEQYAASLWSRSL